MSEKFDADERRKDEQLADLADRILSASDRADDQMQDLDPSLESYREVLAGLKNTLSPQKPPKELEQRLSERIRQAWRAAHSGQSNRNGESAWLRPSLTSERSRWKSGRQRNLALGLRLAFACVLVLAAAMFLAPSINNQLPGAAGTGEPWLALGLSLVALAGLLLWLLIRKR